MDAIEELRESIIVKLRYQEGTGELFWRDTSEVGSHLHNRLAGVLDMKGYRKVFLHGRRYFAHRLVWLLFHGQWPSGVIDHINRDNTDNRIENLRDVSITMNNQNSIVPMRDKKNGLRGTCFHKGLQKWQAQIRVNKKTIYLGVFNTKEEAHKRYIEAKSAYQVGYASLDALGVGDAGN